MKYETEKIIKIENETIGYIIGHRARSLFDSDENIVLEAIARLIDYNFRCRFNRILYRSIWNLFTQTHSIPSFSDLIGTIEKDAELKGYNIEAEIKKRMESAPRSIFRFIGMVNELKGTPRTSQKNNHRPQDRK